MAAFFLDAGDEGVAVAEHQVAGDFQGFGGAGGKGLGERQRLGFEVGFRDDAVDQAGGKGAVGGEAFAKAEQGGGNRTRPSFGPSTMARSFAPRPRVPSASVSRLVSRAALHDTPLCLPASPPQGGRSAARRRRASANSLKLAEPAARLIFPLSRPKDGRDPWLAPPGKPKGCDGAAPPAIAFFTR